MSLIHEALKRLQAEGSAAPISPKPAAGDGQTPPPRPPRIPMGTALAIVACAAVAGSAVMLLIRHTGNTPAPATAVTVDKPRTATPVNPTPAPGRIVPALAPATLPAAQAKKPSVEEPQLRGDARPDQAVESLDEADQDTPPMDPKSFKVSGVMSGPTGQVAIINGQMIPVGGSIGGACLVNISGSSVELVAGKQQVTLQLNRY